MSEDDIGKISYLKADRKLYLVVIICLVIRLFMLFIATLVILYIHIVVGWRISGMIWSRKSIVFHLVLQTIHRQSSRRMPLLEPSPGLKCLLISN